MRCCGSTRLGVTQGFNVTQFGFVTVFDASVVGPSPHPKLERVHIFTYAYLYPIRQWSQSFPHVPSSTTQKGSGL